MELIVNEYGRLTGLGTSLSFLIGIFMLISAIFIGSIIDRLLSNKIREKRIIMENSTKLKAIEALKSNVELKLNTKDIKDLLG